MYSILIPGAILKVLLTNEQLKQHENNFVYVRKVTIVLKIESEYQATPKAFFPPKQFQTSCTEKKYPIFLLCWNSFVKYYLFYLTLPKSQQFSWYGIVISKNKAKTGSLFFII